MIAFIRAYSHEEATDILLRALPAELARDHGDLLEHPHRVAWIGCEPFDSPLHKAMTSAICARRLVLQFRDLEPPRAPMLSEHCATLDHARQIVDYVRAVAAESEPWALAIHCTAGIGRSGSVSRWVQDRYHVLPPQRYAALHRRCQPREWLLDLLRRAEAEG